MPDCKILTSAKRNKTFHVLASSTHNGRKPSLKKAFGHYACTTIVIKLLVGCPP